MSSIYQKLPIDIQDIILNKIFKQQKIRANNYNNILYPKLIIDLNIY